MIKGIIFDLDNCIFDTRGMGKDIVEPIIAVMKKNREFAASPAFRKAAEELWTTGSEEVIRTNHIPEKIAAAMRAAYAKLEVPARARNYADAARIADLRQKKILVTSGHENFQRSKIEKTGIKPYFDEIIIDALDDPAAIKGKKKIFEEIVAKYGWRGAETLVIGDSPTSELAAGKALGMITTQILRPGITKTEGFDHYIKSLTELGEIIAKYK